MNAEEDRAKRTIEFLVKRLRSRVDDVVVDFDEVGVLQYVVMERPIWRGNVVVSREAVHSTFGSVIHLA